MKQVLQALRGGEVSVKDVPHPAHGSRFVLVRTTRSAISAGTEKTKIAMGRKNLAAKAAARPDLVRQVMRKLRSDGFAKTLQTVRARLDAPSPLGYSSVGRVMAVGGEVSGLQPGDRVACAGAGYANHAEVVAVPRNLTVRVPEEVSDDEAAFTTVGAIALQGLRIAQPLIGETFAVVGLGLLGQIAVQLLRANGCRVVGTDPDEALCALAREFGAEAEANPVAFADLCAARSAGRGVDAVLICAGTPSNQPIELSADISREQGRVVVVGAVGMNIPREPYFRKEIRLAISRSYGPGRYDPSYEEDGQDYPYGYVRFTEQRNMEAFLQLLAQRAVSIRRLITHRFAVEDAAQAYDLLASEADSYLGILLEYDGQEDAGPPIASWPLKITPGMVRSRRIGISLFGAGNYATATLLPALARNADVSFAGLATASGRTARDVGERHGFAFCCDGLEGLLGPETAALMIAARHDSHAAAAVAGLEAGKHVYVEKPLALDLAEWASVARALETAGNCQLMVGFNRRFAPLVDRLRAHFQDVAAPLVVTIRVNAGTIPEDHWIHNPRVGGGRLIGEGCHFVDLAAAIAGSLPVEVHSAASRREDRSVTANDNVIVSLRFANGAIAAITYTAKGSTALAKEHVEVFGGGRSAVLEDFRALRLYGAGRERRIRLSAPDKGQAAMLDAWVEGLLTGRPCVPAEELMATSLATLQAVESLKIGGPVPICPVSALRLAVD